jgi:hypothetical protein
MRGAGSLCEMLGMLAVLSGCSAPSARPPIVLHPEAIADPAQAALIRVVKTHPTRGHPTINIRKITRVADSSQVLFQAQAGRGWAVPSHFGGLPDPGQPSYQGDPSELPALFEVLPGRYLLEFLYVPAVDRWGWTHQRTAPEMTWLECEPGQVYFLEGRLEPDGAAWSLRVSSEPRPVIRR